MRSPIDTAGALRSELAALYGVSTGTMSAILASHGAVQRRELTPAQIDAAVAAYLAGDSARTIGDRFGVAATTVRARLIQRGVAMRKTRMRAST